LLVKSDETKKTDYVEEITHPDGSWERIYHGKAMHDAVHELDTVNAETRTKKEKAGKVTVRGQKRVHNQIEQPVAEKWEREGKLKALHEVRVCGVPWGGTKPGCDRCGATHGGLRLRGNEWLCKRKCLPIAEGRVIHGLARDESGPIIIDPFGPG